MNHVLAEFKVVPKASCAEAVRLALELGLEVQSRRHEKSLAERAFTPLSADELTLWSTYCPTHYGAPDMGPFKSLSEYGFDTIPVEVMRHWKSIKDNYTFDSYQIWTVEKTRLLTDPLLIGVIGPNHYLLARWGLESPGDLSVHDIAEKMYQEGLDFINRVYSVPKIFSFLFAKSHRERGFNARREYYRGFAAAERLLGKYPSE